MPETIDQPTDSERIIARAFDVASSYDLRAAREILAADPGGKVLYGNPLTTQGAGHKIISVFDYGAIVFFNFEPDECDAVMEKLKPCTHRLNRMVSKDEFTLLLGGRVKRPEGTDELTVKEFNRDTAILVAVVLSRSVALEYYETLVASSLAQLEQTIGTLAKKGSIHTRETELTRRVGGALLIEHELAYDLSAFDDPEIVWDGGARIGQLYHALKREFDLDDRIKIIQHKVSLISRWCTFVISRLEGHRSRVLEWIIIILILSEILLVLFGKM